MDKSTYEEGQGHQPAAEARPEQLWDAFPHAGRAAQLLAGCESHGQEAAEWGVQGSCPPLETKGGWWVPCRGKEEGVIPGLSLCLKPGSTFRYLVRGTTWQGKSQSVTKTNPLVGAASPSLTSATEWEMCSSHSQRKCCSLPETSDKNTLEDNGAHPGTFSFLPFSAAVKPSTLQTQNNSHPHHLLPRSNL